MRHWWGWLVAAILVVIGAIVLMWHRARGSTSDAAITEAKMIEAWHGQAVKTKQAEIAVLTQAAERDEQTIAKLQAEVTEHKNAITAGYKATGLSADEIAARFRKIKR